MKFKAECGDNFMQTTEQMISDIKQRGDLESAHQSITKKKKPGQHFDFTILDSTKWPIKSNAESVVILPRAIKDVLEEFT